MSADPTALYSRKNPFPAKLRTNRKLTAEGSAKDTRHFEIDLAGSGVAYEVGDSLGVFPTNNPALVQELLSLLGFSGEESVVDTNGQPVTLREALTRFYVITEMDKKLLAAIAEKDPAAAKFTAMVTPEGKADLDAYLWGREVIDALLEYPAAKFTAEELYSCLEQVAYIYICGDASRMAKDVDAALHQVVEKAGGKSPEEAAAYVEELKKSKRYRKDVY